MKTVAQNKDMKRGKQLNKLHLLPNILRKRSRPIALTVNTTQKGVNGLNIRFYSTLNIFALLLYHLRKDRSKIIQKATNTSGYILRKTLSIKRQTLKICINIRSLGL